MMDEYISAIIDDENDGFIDTTDDFEECDDQTIYAHCSDWEDEPDNKHTVEADDDILIKVVSIRAILMILSSNILV